MNYNKEEQEFKEYFLSLFESCSFKIINPINFINFFDKEGHYLMDYDQEDNRFWLSDPFVWSKLEHKFGYSYLRIRELTSNILEEHYKLEGATTSTSVF